MSKKDRDFASLAAAIEVAGTSPPPPPPPVSPKRSGAGRPASDTFPMTLRVSRELYDKLLDAAADATRTERRNITPQQLIIAALEEKYGGDRG